MNDFNFNTDIHAKKFFSHSYYDLHRILFEVAKSSTHVLSKYKISVSSGYNKKNKLFDKRKYTTLSLGLRKMKPKVIREEN